MSPIVAEIYGPDYDGARKVAGKVREQFAKTADIVGIDDTVSEAAPKLMLHVLQSKAALLGVSQRDIVDAMQVALSGQDVTSLHDNTAKYAPPLRLGLPVGAAQPHRRRAQAQGARARRRAGAVVRSGAGRARRSATIRSTTRTCCRWCM